MSSLEKCSDSLNSRQRARSDLFHQFRCAGSCDLQLSCREEAACLDESGNIELFSRWKLPSWEKPIWVERFSEYFTAFLSLDLPIGQDRSVCGLLGLRMGDKSLRKRFNNRRHDV
jgi:hypothetical protein